MSESTQRCNYCRKDTETKDGDCVICGFSKPTRCGMKRSKETIAIDHQLSEKEMMYLEEDEMERAIQAEISLEADDGRLTDHERNYPWFS